MKAEWKKIIWPSPNTLAKESAAVVIITVILGLLIKFDRDGEGERADRGTRIRDPRGYRQDLRRDDRAPHAAHAGGAHEPRQRADDRGAGAR